MDIMCPYNERTAELERVNEQLQYTGSHDALTGLHNRSFFKQEIKQIDVTSDGIIMCDMDGLKFVNDSFGHNRGDALLQAFAHILKSLLGPEDVVARIGGDEFLVLMPDSSRASTEAACLRIRKAVAQYNCDNPKVPLRVSNCLEHLPCQP